MVQVDINEITGNGTIVLKPNNSASWRFNVAIMSSLAIIAFIVSLVFLLQGLWLIFPFSGLEIAILYTGLYICVQRNTTTEVITFHNNMVVIEKGRTHPENSWEYQRSWAKIFGYPKRVFIRSRGKKLELGAFLNKQGKGHLVSKLKNIAYSMRIEDLSISV